MKQYILTNPMATQRTSKAKIDQSDLKKAAVEPDKADVIYLGVDVHLRQQVVCRKVDGAAPQPAQRFGPEEFKLWVARQMKLAHKVVCCYEAGPFGYVLHRHLEKAGVECLVVRPQNWDTHGRRVKTDGRDACALVEGLARYKEGNNKALAVVTVPQEQVEQRRALTRYREDLVKEVRRMALGARGRALTQGLELGHRWWRPKAWAVWLAKLPQWLSDILDCSREALLVLERGVARCTEQIEALARPSQERPKGLGALSEQIINNEVIDWGRFSNRGQVSSYTGLCPSEYSSGGSRRQGGINRHGNRRLRTALVEAAWRLMRHQPKWKRLEKVREKLLLAQSGRGKPGSKKKIAVELARGLAVDLWRLNTGKATLQELGLEPA